MRAKNKKPVFRNILRKVIFATNIMAIALLLCSLLSWRVSPLRTNLFSYIGLVFGLILLINVCFLLFWVFLAKWKHALVSLAAILLCYQPVTTFFPMNLFPQKAPDGAIKVLSYNVQGFLKERSKRSGRHPVLEYIARTDADIVCLQEYFVSKTGHSLLSQNDVNRILKQYPYHSVIGLESSGKYHIYGLACFSKFPIEKQEEVVFPSSFNGAALYTINIRGKRYTVANVHLESNRIKAEDKKLYSDFILNNESVKLEQVTQNIRTRMGRAYRVRAGQVKQVKQRIATQETEGVILCADFNDTPISYAYYEMKKGLKDSYASSGFGPGITYHEDLFLFRIDFIMHSKQIKAYNGKVDRLPFSDHYPLSTYLMLPESNSTQ